MIVTFRLSLSGIEESMMAKKIQSSLAALLVAALLTTAAGCGEREKITDISQLKGKEFAVPTGTVVDKLVLSKIPDAKFKYFNSLLDACMAVTAGKVDAAACDGPMLKNIAAKSSGMVVLPQMLTTDNYGFAVRPEDKELKSVIDGVIGELKSSGRYDSMIKRWLPDRGAPQPMPQIETGSAGILRFGTSATAEPFSFVDGSQRIVGMDIEIASLVAQKLNRKLEIVNMDIGGVIPALTASKVDMIGACITITEERAQKVLFSEPYYTGGIAALVKE
jgi:polar amino acid transport system substrate-binding protein